MEFTGFPFLTAILLTCVAGLFVILVIPEQRQAQINVADGEKQQAIKASEGEKMKRINEAEGRAQEIELVANATAAGIRSIATAINEPGGYDAVNLRVAEQYIGEFGKLAKEGNTLIIPSNLSEVGGMVAAATSLIKKS